MTTAPESLLTETLEAMTENGQSPTDVACVSTATGGRSCTWATFANIADTFAYETGQELGEIVVVFADGSWLERDDHNGFEWWTYKATPRPSADAEQLTAADLKPWK